MDNCRDHWRPFACVVRDHRFHKKRHKGQNLQCQLDLPSKSVIKEIVLRIEELTIAVLSDERN